MGLPEYTTNDITPLWGERQQNKFKVALKVDVLPTFAEAVFGSGPFAPAAANLQWAKEVHVTFASNGTRWTFFEKQPAMVDVGPA